MMFIIIILIVISMPSGRTDKQVTGLIISAMSLQLYYYGYSYKMSGHWEPIMVHQCLARCQLWCSWQSIICKLQIIRNFETIWTGNETKTTKWFKTFKEQKVGKDCSGVEPCEISRTSRSQMFFKTDDLKNLANFTGKHLC